VPGDTQISQLTVAGSSVPYDMRQAGTNVEVAFREDVAVTAGDQLLVALSM
jgi:hypothetical protein